VKLFGQDNFQNQFIRFSIKNIYQNHYEKIKKRIKKVNKNSFLKSFYTTELNNQINYEELNNYIQVYLNNHNLKKNDVEIKKNIISNYLN
tara:strand:+ start:214 stop:483 length:270 start_codon:yes stop_codon:yes gene_type:complete